VTPAPSNTRDKGHRRRGRASTARLIGAKSLVTATLLLLPASAPGAHTFRETFGSAAQPSFTKAEGLAVDQASDDLLVVDAGTGAGTGTVERYQEDGTPSNFADLGTNSIGGLSFGGPGEVQVAVDNSGEVTNGDIYVTQGSADRIEIFAGTGSLLGQLTESSEGPFSEPCGVGVDESGAVYVGDFGATDIVHKYVPSANPPVKADNVANFTSLEGPSSICTLAAGAGETDGSIFVDRFNGELFKLDSATGALKYKITTGVTTVTVDPGTGHVFAAKGSEVVEFDASGATLGELDPVEPPFTVPSKVTGIAVNGATGDVYVAREGSPQIEVWGLVTSPDVITEAATSVGAESATLNGSVNPNGQPLNADPSEGCFFEWGETESYGQIAPCEEPDAEEVGEGNSFVPVHADLSGLEPGTTYHFRLNAEGANGFSGQGDDEEFTTPGPSIAEVTATQVTASAAKITAEIDPNGEATTFFVQYVSDAKFSESEFAEATDVPVPPKAVGSGAAPVAVAQQLSGLNPGTTYHFRIVAANPAATVRSPEQTFTTFVQAPGGLPDGRVYELVSPTHKVGEPFPPEPNEHLGGSCAAAGGGVRCMPGGGKKLAPMQSDPDGEAIVYQGQPFAGGLAADTNEYLSSRSAGGWETEGLSSSLFNDTFRAFSRELQRSVFLQLRPLTPDAPQRGGEGFLNLYLWEEGVLSPILSEEPPNRDPGISSANKFVIVFGGANAGSALAPAFGHVLFAANDALTEATAFGPKAPEVSASVCNVGQSCNLYEWAEGELRLINVLPGNASAASGAMIGSRISEGEPPAVDHAISDDGSRIFWSDGAGQAYVRIDGEETREIDDPGTPGRFLTASADGATVLLGDGCLYEIEAEECEDLTGGEGGFQGILGAAEDLSRIYFVDTEVLTGEEENANGEQATDGKFNLYLWEEGDTSFIAALLDGDNKVSNLPLEHIGAWQASSTQRTAQVSPEGRYLAFMSRAPLTRYDNTAVDGECGFNKPAACFEVFAYDAATESLVCASCNPSGQRPLGGSNLSLVAELVADREAGIPAPHNLTTAGEGRLFFESQDTLSTRDTNGQVQDVYEWEPNGVGSCEEPGGCVYLISSGNDPADSMFMNSTPSGDDAFFLTRERLLGRDKDELLDLYDARAPHVPGEAVGFPEGKTPPCGGEACADPIAPPPPQPAPGSAGFSGEGNASPTPKARRCARGKVRRRGRCVARHKHRRRAGHNRRATR
jgi:hypothetical protein